MNHEQLASGVGGDKTEKIDLNREAIKKSADFGKLAIAAGEFQARIQASLKEATLEPAAADSNKDDRDVSEKLMGVLKGADGKSFDIKTSGEIWIKLSIVKRNREVVQDLETQIAALTEKIREYDAAGKDAEKQKCVAEQYKLVVEAGNVRKDTFTIEQLVMAKGVEDVNKALGDLESAGVMG